MSLFSNTRHECLASSAVVTARAGPDGTFSATSRTAILGTMLGMLIIMTIVAIMIVHLRPAPAFPGNRIGGQQNAVRFVEALDTLQKKKSVIPTIYILEGGERHDWYC